MKNKNILNIALIIILIAGIFLPLIVKAQNYDDMPNRSLTLADPSISVATSYSLQFDTVNTYLIGSVKLEFCQEDPIPNAPCTAPSNMTSLAATLISQTGTAYFNVVGTNVNRVVLGRSPPLQDASTFGFNIGNIVNPDIARTYYARIYLYTSEDGSGTELAHAGIAYAINKSLGISSEVPPNLLFCVAATIPLYDCGSASGNFLDFGNLSTANARTVQHNMLVATNAGSGINVTVSGNTLTAGNNIIAALVSPSASVPGSAQFGFNLRFNSNPSGGQDPVGPGVGVIINPRYDTPNQFTFNNGDSVLSSTSSIDYYKTTATYLANISAAQLPGIYSTTIVYICLANF